MTGNCDIKVVVQEEVSGCGIACVAMLANTTYKEMKIRANTLGIFAEDKRLWSETEYVRTLLRDYNLQVSPQEKPFTSWEDLPDLALIAIKYHLEHGRPYWHWSIFQRQGQTEVVLDPAKYLDNNKRDDFDQMQPQWSIEVYE